MGVFVELCDAELAGSTEEACEVNSTLELERLAEEALVRLDGETLVRLEEGELEVRVVDVTKVVTAPDCPCLSIVKNGYGSSEVVRLVVQQLGPSASCPAAPAQYQLLPFGSQRLTSVKSSNCSLSQCLLAWKAQEHSQRG